jgi:hypothetical protein
MSTLVINDLVVSKDLDRAAVIQVRGGYVGGWQVARLDPQSLGAVRPPVIDYITNNYIDYNVSLYQNPTIFNVFNSVGNGNSGNSGNLSFNTLSVNAASPVNAATPALIG